MIKIKKLVFLPISMSLFLVSCGSKPSTKTFTISFSGDHVSFPVDKAEITNDKDYSIITTPDVGYKISQSSFVVKLDNQVVNPDFKSWSWSDNVLSIDKSLIKGSITVTGKSDLMTFNLDANKDSNITFTSSIPSSISAQEDLVIDLTLNSSSKNVAVSLKVDNNQSNLYSLTSTSKTNYQFTLKKENICGDVTVNFTSVSDAIHVSANSVSILTYGNDTLIYDIPGGITKDDITVESSNTDLFTVVHDKDKRTVQIESNLNGSAGNGNVIFKNNGIELLSVPVTINHPTNIEQAMDAFTLASMKVNNGTDDCKIFNVRFNFNNDVGVEDFDVSLEIYGRRGAIGYDYEIGNRNNRFQVETSQSAANQESGIKKTDKNYYFNNLTNLNYEYRKKKDSYSRDFYIDYVTKTINVENSDELFWAVEHHYRPIITDTNLQLIYNKAKAICASTVSVDNDDFTNARLLYDRLNSITHYDHYVVSRATRPWYNYTSYFLEGIFNDTDNQDNQYDGIAVCDGFSKAYALLCGIVGIPCIRSYGFDNYNSGHAWNYVQVDGSWYLCCPTWCKLDDNSGALSEIYGGKAVSIMNYTAFMASKNYFADAGGGFSDLSFPITVSRSSTYYAGNLSILSKDKVGNYSYNLNSYSCANALKDVARTASDNSYMCLSIPKNSAEETVDTWLRTIASATPSNLDCYGLYMNASDSYNYLNCWLLFKAA